MALSAAERRVIELAVKTTGEQDLRRMANELGYLRRSAQESQASLTAMQSGFRTLAANARGFIAAIGVQQVIGWGRAILQAADDLGAAAEQAGIAVERYQSLKEAFRALEVDARKFELGTEKIAIALSDVLAGNVTNATKALERLGVTAKILSGEITTTDQVIDAMAQSTKALTDDQTFLGDVTDIVGAKIGVDYANALKNGKLATEEMRVATEQFGVVTEEELAKLEEAAEVVEQFQHRAGNAILKFSAAAIEHLRDVGDDITRFVQHTREGMSLLEAGRRTALENRLEARQAGLDAWLKMRVGTVEEMFSKPPTPPVIPRRTSSGGGGGGEAREARDAAAAEREAAEAARDRARALTELRRSLDALHEEQAAARKSLEEQARALEEAVHPGQLWARQMAELNALNAEYPLSAEAYAAAQETINETLRTNNRLLVENSEAERQRREEQERAAKELQKVRDEWGFVADAMAQATYDIISGSEKISRAIRRMVATIIAELIRLQLTKLAIRIFGGGAEGGFGSKVADILTGSLKGSASGNVFARGGIVTAPTVHGIAGGGLGLMGEAGPEAVVPLVRGSNGKLGLASPGLAVTVNNYAGAAVEVRQSSRGLEIDVVRKVLADDIRRGGSPLSAALEATYRVGRQESAR